MAERSTGLLRLCIPPVGKRGSSREPAVDESDGWEGIVPSGGETDPESEWLMVDG